MPRVQIVLVDRIVGPLGGLLRRELDRPPSVRNKAVQVVDRLVAIERAWTAKQDRAGAEEGFNESSGSRRSVSTPPLLPFVSHQTKGTVLEEPKNS